MTSFEPFTSELNGDELVYIGGGESMVVKKGHSKESAPFLSAYERRPRPWTDNELAVMMGGSIIRILEDGGHGESPEETNEEAKIA